MWCTPSRVRRSRSTPSTASRSSRTCTLRSGWQTRKRATGLVTVINIITTTTTTTTLHHPHAQPHALMCYLPFCCSRLLPELQLYYLTSPSISMSAVQVYVNSLHPGLVETEITRGVQDTTGALAAFVTNAVMSTIAYSADDGALTQLYLATSPDVETYDIRGKYYIPIADQYSTSAAGRNKTQQALTMKWTLQELAARGFVIA